MPRLPNGEETRKDPDANGKYGGLVRIIIDNINDTNLRNVEASSQIFIDKLALFGEHSDIVDLAVCAYRKS